MAGLLHQLAPLFVSIQDVLHRVLSYLAGVVGQVTGLKTNI